MKVYLLGIFCFAVFFISCKETKQKAAETRPVKKAIGKLVTDSMAPPVITPIAPAKPLPVIVTTKPYSLDPRVGKEAITTLTPANGLPLGRSYEHLVQDHLGNLWFTNRTSIIKYDGHDFTPYPLVPGTNVYCSGLAIANNNELWAVIQKRDSTGSGVVAGLYVFKGNSFEPLPVTQTGQRLSFSDMKLFPQADGTIWVSMRTSKQLMKFAGRLLQQTITPKVVSFKLITDIKTDKQGNTWFVDNHDSSLIRYDGHLFKKFTAADGLPRTRPFSVLPFAADSIYLSTSDGSWYFNGRQSVKFSESSFSSYSSDKQGTLWISIEDGVNKISSAGITSLKREDGLGVAGNWNFGSDREENVWLLSNNSLNRLYKPVTIYAEIFPSTGISRGVRSFYNDRQGHYWFGSYIHGISCYRGNSLTNYSFLKDTKGSSLTDNNIGDILQDKAGNIWMSTFGGSLIKYDGKSFFTYNVSNSLGVIYIYKLGTDSKGNIWFPTVLRGKGPSGVACFNGKETESYSTEQGLCDNDVRNILEDHTGAMWFATNNGLSRFRNGRFTTFNREDGLANNVINALAEDTYGNLWLGTDGGISRFDGAQFINYTTEEGLAGGNVLTIKADSANNAFWLASEVGFTVMRLKANHPDSVQFENYSEAEGFPVKGVNFDFLIDRQGLLWTSEGNNSIKRFDYKRVKENSKPFNLHLTQIRLNNEVICWSQLKDNGKDTESLQMEMQLRFGKLLSLEELEQKANSFGAVRYDSIIPFDFIPYNLSLSYHANSISFDFAAIDPHFSKSTQYQYMLEGFDKNWSPLSKNNNASFGNLREGSYTFKVKALNPYGIWSEMSYSFRVRPPWHRTWWAYLIYALFVGGTIYAFIRWRTKKLQKEKAVLEDKVAARTTELKESLEHLKATQSQLVQSEKMASLGELTAGIAHEIQNPLNFVNNFSEVNKELIEELKGERRKAEGVRDPKLEDELLDDIAQNEEKINHHGKRADAIVKGMLQHSRSSTGQKESTDINALCDEYMRLAYHGLRAKDKNFNATIKTDFDASIGNINIIPQDIGRVVLNLINNAFYACTERLTQANAEKNRNAISEREGLTANSFQLTASPYVPTVSLTTKKAGNTLEIKVADNGNGIPQKILDKIFQPFFTTKPTGQGTGLGLSLSYDIMKAHGGELKVETKEREGSTFIIQIPV